ncbi:hypothetical protein Cgig2_012054 [Carnegiea gigantea]|uniref:Cytochrome b561 and DOMON domain-containing protein n=1 Tax=Carnegiea gigantea TaxID=171969 RepID=A0A9Q1KQQ1_9CARY|nr:hypothetical protein Cgig2_012054 [Carnegiea gigantea]
MGRRRITTTTTCLLLISVIITTLLSSPATAQSCKGFTFQSNRQYATCNDLPVLNAHLYWTYNSSQRTADIAFRATGVNPGSNWVAWALNPTQSGMLGAQALVAYRNSSGAPYAYTSSVSNYTTTLAPSSLSFPVEKISATVTGSEIIIFATIRPPTTTVNQAWQVGPLSGGTPGAHAPSGPNVRSAGTIDFLSGQTTSTGNVAGSRQRRRNVHGVLNAVSWGTLMPLGAIIARYMRVFKSADPAWFYLHVGCQFSAYVVGVAGWGLGLKLGRESQGIVYHPHRNIGIALFCLATLQVFALLVRPKKDHKYRLYWNIYHHSMGYVVIILSIINIFKGFDILNLDTNKWKRVYIGILIGLGAIAVVLEAITWGVVLKRKKDTPEKHHANGANGHSNGYGARTQPVV